MLESEAPKGQKGVVEGLNFQDTKQTPHAQQAQTDHEAEKLPA